MGIRKTPGQSFSDGPTMRSLFGGYGGGGTGATDRNGNQIPPGSPGTRAATGPAGGGAPTVKVDGGTELVSAARELSQAARALNTRPNPGHPDI
jgi:hypothetical protein